MPSGQDAHGDALDVGLRFLEEEVDQRYFVAELMSLVDVFDEVLASKRRLDRKRLSAVQLYAQPFEKNPPCTDLMAGDVLRIE